MFTSCPGDDAFGPVIQGCRDAFDFTMFFERILLSILPNGVFLVISLFQIVALLRRGARGYGASSRLLAAKSVCTRALAIPLRLNAN